MNLKRTLNTLVGSKIRLEGENFDAAGTLAQGGNHFVLSVGEGEVFATFCFEATDVASMDFNEVITIHLR